MVLDRINHMLQMASDGRAPFPPTVLFNENWLLRIVLDWFSEQPGADHPLGFLPGATCFSEALLPSAFLPRYKGDPLAESWTHGDGVVGHFRIGIGGKGDLSLVPDAKQLVVLEGKIFSPLSSGTKNAPGFDQAARNVACIAEVLRRTGKPLQEMERLGFYVVAPESRIEAGVFGQRVTRASIRQKVERRVARYEGERDEWLSDWFAPTLDRIRIGCLSWESILVYIEQHNPRAGRATAGFYEACLQFNRATKRTPESGQ